MPIRWGQPKVGQLVLCTLNYWLPNFYTLKIEPIHFPWVYAMGVSL